MIDALYTITMLELFLGGGGRLIEIGPATLRMLLFAVCLGVTVLAAMFRARRADGQVLALSLVVAYLLIHLPGLLIGLLKGAEPAQIFTEFQQSLYWLAAPFFAMVLQSPQMVWRTATLLKIAGVLLALAYLLALLALAIGVIDFSAVLALLSESGEFSGRGSAFLFYKGFLYLGIAIVFLVAMRGRYWKLLTIVVVAALVLTLTRGFILSTSTAILLLLAVQGRKRMLGVGVLGVCVAVVLIWSYLPSDGIVSGRAVSNNQRIEDAVYIFDHVSIGTLLVGEGFGSLINQRLNIENTFLWALWKLGLTGFLFWFAPFFFCAYYFMSIPRRGSNPLACGYFFGTVLVYTQTMTNPYLNNPIGLAFVMLALFSLRTLAKHSRLATTPAGVTTRTELA